MTKQMLSSLGMKITKVQALLKAVELAQRGLATDESKEVVLCMQAARQVLESISAELSEAIKGR
ncbi:MAG: hypothetical protein ACT4P8_12785 [Betaproteobacteria bacterium]